MLLEFAAALDLCVENAGSTPTFQGPMGKNVLDVTFSRLFRLRKIEGWRVLEDPYSDSDHNYVVYELMDGAHLMIPTSGE